MSDSQSPTFLAETLDEVMQRTGVVALSVLVLRDGTTIDVAAAGRRQNNKRTEVAPGDVWHIASCGKAMTATMIARLVEKGGTIVVTPRWRIPGLTTTVSSKK